MIQWCMGWTYISQHRHLRHCILLQDLYSTLLLICIEIGLVVWGEQYELHHLSGKNWTHLRLNSNDWATLKLLKDDVTQPAINGKDSWNYLEHRRASNITKHSLAMSLWKLKSLQYYRLLNWLRLQQALHPLRNELCFTVLVEFHKNCQIHIWTYVETLTFTDQSHCIAIVHEKGEFISLRFPKLKSPC